MPMPYDEDVPAAEELTLDGVLARAAAAWRALRDVDLSWVGPDDMAVVNDALSSLTMMAMHRRASAWYAWLRTALPCPCAVRYAAAASHAGSLSGHYGGGDCRLTLAALLWPDEAAPEPHIPVAPGAEEPPPMTRAAFMAAAETVSLIRATNRAHGAAVTEMLDRMGVTMHPGPGGMSLMNMPLAAGDWVARGPGEAALAEPPAGWPRLDLKSLDGQVKAIERVVARRDASTRQPAVPD